MPFLAFADSDAVVHAAHALISSEEMEHDEKEERLKSLLNKKALTAYNKWKCAKEEADMVFLKLLTPALKKTVKEKLAKGDLETAAVLISTATPAAVTAFTAWRSRSTSSSNSSVFSTRRLTNNLPRVSKPPDTTRVFQSAVTRRRLQVAAVPPNNTRQQDRIILNDAQPPVKRDMSSSSRQSSVTSHDAAPEGGYLWDFMIPSDCGGLVNGQDGKTRKTIEEKFSVTIHVNRRGSKTMVSVKSPNNAISIHNACLDIWCRMSYSQRTIQQLDGIHAQKLATWTKPNLVKFMCETQTYILLTHSSSGVTAQISGWTTKSVLMARDTIVYNRLLNPAPFGLWNITIPVNKGGLVIGKEGKTLKSIEDKYKLKMDVVARGAICEIRTKEAKSRDDVLSAYLDIYWRISHSQSHKEALSTDLAAFVRRWDKYNRLSFICGNKVYFDTTDDRTVTMCAWSPDELNAARLKLEGQHANAGKTAVKPEKPTPPQPAVVKPSPNVKKAPTATAKPVPVKNMMSPAEEEMNILLLGESGIGKSTFINGFHNHLKHMSFEDARRKGVDVCIRASFSYLDASGTSHNVTVESAEDATDKANEVLENGKSATQEPRSYVFEVKRGDVVKRIRLIDTPGVLDTSGMEQDLLNMKKTFAYVSNFKKLNAICILMRADEVRLNHYVRYCISELLTRLHCDASRNLLFCFTRSSGTDFRPAGTLDLLRRLVEDMKKDDSVKIKLNNDSMFCFDSLPFRLLCALKAGHRLSAEEIKSARESWEQSAAQMKRMLLCAEKLPQHDVQKTVTVNEARASVLSLARPLADITKNQILNQETIKEKMAEQSIRAVPLKNPQLVCADPMCVDYKTIGERTELHYKVVCHDNCVTDTKENGDQQVQKCSVFASGVDRCAKCGHSWKYHTHIRYKLEMSTKTIDSSGLKGDIEKNNNAVAMTKEFIASLKKKHVAMNVDLNLLASCCAKFAAFVDANSIMSYNDTYKQFIDAAIKEEDCNLGSAALLDRLKEFKANYELQIKTMKGTGNVAVPSVEEVKKLINDLKSRNLSGGFLARALNLQRVANVGKGLKERLFAVGLDEEMPEKREAVAPHTETKGGKGPKEKAAKESCSVM